MRLTILGSTGSIGQSTLDLVQRHADQFDVFALTGATQVEKLHQQCLQFNPSYAVVVEAEQAQRLEQMLRQSNAKTEVLYGAKALEEVSTAPEVDAVMAAIVGAAGLKPAIAAAQAGKRILLANKEALVLSGALFQRALQQGGGELFPVDSEHSAIFQCLPEERSRWPQVIEKLILTASGGPFRTRDPKTFSSITPNEACAHPNWSMGRKISVDSATMMNKALEVIEAHWIFQTPADAIEAVIHPESIIHSMVQCVDGSVLAQMGVPDMRVPIEVSMVWPSRIESGVSRLDFSQLSQLTFETVDEDRFPCFSLAWQALAGSEGTTAILNAANEVAVDAFLSEEIRFDQIYSVVAESLSKVVVNSDAKSLDALFALDVETRSISAQLIQELKV